MCTQKGRAKTLNKPPIHAGLVGWVERERERVRKYLFTSA